MALRELAALFLRLGATAFGGPAAHVALMQREAVERRGWMDGGRFAELVGATNMIPGPNSTELAMEIGRQRAGLRGLLVAGLCFIAPSTAIVLVLAWLYVEHGRTVAARAILYGIEPVVVAIIAIAVVRLARTAVRGWTTAAIAVASFVALLFGVHELIVLAAAAALQVSASSARHPPALLLPLAAPSVAPLLAGAGPDLLVIFAAFLRFGATVFGSGYVLIAFLRGDLVERLGWLTEQQLIDAVAAGQVTPGPLFTTATFVGYVVGGFGGAVAATVGIFLPAFVLVAVLGRLLDRAGPAWRAALEGLAAAAVGLMAAVAVRLGEQAVLDPLTTILAAAAIGVLLATKVNPVWAIAAGALTGLAARAV